MSVQLLYMLKHDAPSLCSYCKSICRFLKHGNLIPGSNLICNDSDGPFPKGRNECFVPFFAHDEVHPSAL